MSLDKNNPPTPFPSQSSSLTSATMFDPTQIEKEFGRDKLKRVTGSVMIEAKIGVLPYMDFSLLVNLRFQFTGIW